MYFPGASTGGFVALKAPRRISPRNSAVSDNGKMVSNRKVRELQMQNKCPHCDRALDPGSTYCSDRCRRAIHGQRLRIALITMLSMAALALAMLILPHGELKLEPKHFPSPAEIKTLATGDACPVCDGKSRLKCRICINGKIYYMGTSAVCSHCAGQGWIVCVTCRGTGKLRESLTWTPLPRNITIDTRN